MWNIKVKTPRFLMMLLIGCTFLVSSCEDSSDDKTPPPSPSEIGLTTSLANNDGTKPLYIYGARDIDFSVSADKGSVDLVQFVYQGAEIESFTSPSGKFHFTPDMSKEEATELEMKITMTVEEKTHSETIKYKVQGVKISKEDFELKDATIGSFVFKMTGERLDNYKYVLGVGGETIEDLDNITLERKYAQYSFPMESSVRIFLVPKEHEYMSSNSHYPSVTLSFVDKTLGSFHAGSTLSHYVDAAHEELYVWSLGELSIFDKNLTEVKHQPIEDVYNFFVTPKTGLVVAEHLFGSVTTYSDKSFSSVVSKIEPEMRTDILHVNERDQLFNGQNFQIDVYDLRTGALVYSLTFSEDHVKNYIILGDKLLVQLGYDGKNEVYQLNEKSATLLYSLDKKYRNCIQHPVNRTHIILDNTYEGFEIFDLETRTTIKSFKGQYQSVDPIEGTLLYYDENYGRPTYANHVVGLDYEKILTFEDASQSTYGAFVQFNNYVIKSDRYTNLLPKE